MSFSSQVNMLFADDHPLYRQGLIRTITSLPLVNICHEAPNGQVAVEMCKARHYHFVLLDLEMPVMDGLSAARLIRQCSPDTHIIIISQHDTRRLVIELLELGVKGYILKTTDASEILRALTLILEGNKYFTPEVLKIWTEYIMDKSLKTPVVAERELSAREREIIRLLCDQKTAPEIGDILCISPETVNKHRSNIMKKIDVKNVAGLVIYAVQHQIFLPDSASKTLLNPSLNR
jgi:DNA-binding NarL/FixJ family response regulator